MESADNHKERQLLYETRTGRRVGLAASSSCSPSFVVAFAIFIVLDWHIDVKAYLMLCADGLPEADRPARCEHCPSERIPHRHGKFMRWLFTIDEAFYIPIFRFLCSDCRKSICVLPGFVEAHHQSALEVKEAVIQATVDGRSLPEIAEESNRYVGGIYSEKTLWRWVRCWKTRRDIHEERLWNDMIRSGMDEPLPRERKSGWQALFRAWASLGRADSFFHALLYLDRSSVLTSVRQNPTEAGHG